MKTNVTVTEQQMSEAQQAFDVSALNGIVGLAAGLRGHGLLSDTQVDTLYQNMSKPLSEANVADNPAVQLMQAHIDAWFATLLQHKPPA